MHSEVRSALTGHSAKMDESAMYGDEMKTFVHLLAENIAKVKVALLSNSGPGVLANFGPPPVPQPTVTLMDRGAFWRIWDRHRRSFRSSS
jgi:hypothetical protein